MVLGKGSRGAGWARSPALRAGRLSAADRSGWEGTPRGVSVPRLLLLFVVALLLLPPTPPPPPPPAQPAGSGLLAGVLRAGAGRGRARRGLRPQPLARGGPRGPPRGRGQRQRQRRRRRRGRAAWPGARPASSAGCGRAGAPGGSSSSSSSSPCSWTTCCSPWSVGDRVWRWGCALRRRWLGGGSVFGACLCFSLVSLPRFMPAVITGDRCTAWVHE